MNAAAITRKINKVATKYGSFSLKKIYLRVVTETGGNTLIDQGVTRTYTDTVFVPQPLLKRAAIVPSRSTPVKSIRSDVLTTGSGIIEPGDYEFLFTPTQMTSVQVANKANIVVLKDVSGNEEQLAFVSCNPVVLNGVEIGVTALYRSASRQ